MTCARPVLHSTAPAEESRAQMPQIGAPELIIILVIVLVVFGPGKLPDIGNAIGRGLREFRRASSDIEDSIRGDAKPTDTSPKS